MTSKKTQDKLNELRQLELPLGHYAVTGSGPMGIRGLREIGDVDIIVSMELWDTLADQYGITEENGIKRIVLANGKIDALGPDSFASLPKDPSDPLFGQRLADAELIDGLPFESLTHVIHFKKRMGRPKDLKDIDLIVQWQESNR